MVDFLSALGTGVGDDAKPPLRVGIAALLHRQPRRQRHEAAEQARIVQLLVARVDLGADTMSIKFHANGIADLVEEMGAISSQEQKAV